MRLRPRRVLMLSRVDIPKTMGGEAAGPGRTMGGKMVIKSFSGCGGGGRGGQDHPM